MTGRPVLGDLDRKAAHAPPGLVAAAVAPRAAWDGRDRRAVADRWAVTVQPKREGAGRCDFCGKAAPTMERWDDADGWWAWCRACWDQQDRRRGARP